MIRLGVKPNSINQLTQLPMRGSNDGIEPSSQVPQTCILTVELIGPYNSFAIYLLDT